MVPILGALILQAAYGAVDLLVVGRFGSTSGLSAVSTGSQVLNLVTFVVTQLAMGITVLIARYLGCLLYTSERLFRWKYAWVIKNRPETLEFAYDLNPHNAKTWIGGDKEPSVLSIMSVSYTHLPTSMEPSPRALPMVPAL